MQNSVVVVGKSKKLFDLNQIELAEYGYQLRSKRFLWKADISRMKIMSSVLLAEFRYD